MDNFWIAVAVFVVIYMVFGNNEYKETFGMNKYVFQGNETSDTRSIYRGRLIVPKIKHVMRHQDTDGYESL